MGFSAKLAAIFLLLGLPWFSARAQHRHDPLTDVEINLLRDSAQDADTRLKLYVQFARDRLTALEKMRTDPKVTDRAQQTHDGLQAFLDVYDELDDNIDTFDKREADLRKPLKHIVEADNEFQAKLRALREAAGVSPGEAKEYEFLLSNALDTVTASAKDHRDLLTEQEEAWKHKKKSSQQGAKELR